GPLAVREAPVSRDGEAADLLTRPAEDAPERPGVTMLAPDRTKVARGQQGIEPPEVDHRGRVHEKQAETRGQGGEVLEIGEQVPRTLYEALQEPEGIGLVLLKVLARERQGQVPLDGVGPREVEVQGEKA